MIKVQSQDGLMQAERGEQRPHMPPAKLIVFSIISLFMAVLGFCIVSEVILRILPLGRYENGIYRQYDPLLGESLIPNVGVIHSRGCFQGLVRTNSWAFRDRDRTLEKPPEAFRVALIGDSAIEAAQVQPNEVVNIQMEQMLHDQGYPRVEVLAFGIGAIGTTQELLLYENKIRQFHPDVVVLTFSANDVMNNSSTLQPETYGIHTWYSPYYDLGTNGELVFRPVESKPLNWLVKPLEHHSKLLYYFERVWFQFDYSPYKWHGVPIYYGTWSDDPLDPDWQQAWNITSKVLARFDREVSADGGRFLVLAWPNFYDIDTAWRRSLLKEIGTMPAQLNPAKFSDHLRDAAQKANVPLDFTAPYFQAYRDEHHLQWPYFSFSCDPHLSSMGHRIAAAAIIQKLEEYKLLPPKVTE